MRSILAATAAVAAMAFTAPALADHHKTMDHSAHSASHHAMMTALADARRDGDRARDEFRNPAETLAFFKVEPGMIVADVVPGGGWYTRVLVPHLGLDGQYIGLNPDMRTSNSPQMAERWSGLAEKFPAQLAEWGLAGSNAKGTNLDLVGDDAAGTVDRVLIFREMHNLYRLNLAYSTLTGARKLLKDDGLLGIVQHRAKEDASADYTDGSKGYLRQKDVIALAEAHGFELVETSEINANAADTADHERGVWEMPPSWGTKKEELKDLGESDRMTLLFRKRP
jgi:predicted methyltransferase